MGDSETPPAAENPPSPVEISWGCRPDSATIAAGVLEEGPQVARGEPPRGLPRGTDPRRRSRDPTANPRGVGDESRRHGPGGIVRRIVEPPPPDSGDPRPVRGHLAR